MLQCAQRKTDLLWSAGPASVYLLLRIARFGYCRTALSPRQVPSGMGCAESWATMRIPFAQQRNAHGQLVLDPCLICGISQHAHWKCRICTSRGHAMGRGTLLPDLCAWCQDELLALLKRDGAS